MKAERIIEWNRRRCENAENALMCEVNEVKREAAELWGEVSGERAELERKLWEANIPQLNFTLESLRKLAKAI